MTANVEKAELGAIRRCDGMGEPALDGDYVLMTFQPDWGKLRAFRISIGQATVLLDELRGCLAADGRL